MHRYAYVASKLLKLNVQYNPKTSKGRKLSKNRSKINYIPSLILIKDNLQKKINKTALAVSTNYNFKTKTFLTLVRYSNNIYTYTPSILGVLPGDYIGGLYTPTLGSITNF